MWQQHRNKHLKQALICAPVLALPDFIQPFVLEINASGFGIGPVMQQAKHVAFYCVALFPRNIAMCACEKEALAIVEAL